MTALNGFTRAITLDSGISLSAAYYRVEGLRIANSTSPKRVSFTLAVWSSKAARDLGKSPISGVPGETQFIVAGEAFTTWFAPAVLNAEGVNPLSQAYLYAKDQIADPAIVDVEE